MLMTRKPATKVTIPIRGSRKNMPKSTKTEPMVPRIRIRLKTTHR